MSPSNMSSTSSRADMLFEQTKVTIIIYHSYCLQCKIYTPKQSCLYIIHLPYIAILIKVIALYFLRNIIKMVHHMYSVVDVDKVGYSDFKT